MSKHNGGWDAEYIHDSIIRRPNFQGKGHREGAARGWNVREFIGWDGEGITFDEPPLLVGEGMVRDPKTTKIRKSKENDNPPQNYVLLANSKGEELINKDGCTTVDCLEMFLNTQQRWPLSIHVGFSFNYDVNQIIKDLPIEKLRSLHKNEGIRWRGYKIIWRPNKTFYVNHRKTNRSFILYDVFGYFQKSFLQTCIDYLGKDDPNLQTIQEGKESRDHFEWEELDTHIRPYCMTELFMLVKIMNKFREQLHYIDLVPAQWYGPGGIAAKVFQKNKIELNRDIPEEILDASQFAYAGGRFEQFYMGRCPNTVWEYDIHSAYPAAAIHLPDISRGSWESVKRFEPGTFGVWYIEYRGDVRYISGPLNRDRPQPLFCRSESGSISYPPEVQGWYWTPEAELVSDYVKEGYVFRPDSDDRPFAFIEELYEQRRLHKQQKNPVERAEKLALNSIYGKLAQTVGAQQDENGELKPPRWHQLEYAGYITSYTRAQIYKAIDLAPNDIIAAETDAVFSRVPLDLPLTDNLGDWEETIFDEIMYIQSGFYYGMQNNKIIPKSRGMDRDRRIGNQPKGLPRENVLNTLLHCIPSQRNTMFHWALSCTSTRFIGLGYGLMTSSTWRSWEKVNKTIHLISRDTRSKRLHIPDDCEKCVKGISLGDDLHPLAWGGYQGPSYARAIPWRSLGKEAKNLDPEETLEMNTDELNLLELDRWQ